jgi:hypothetical protein
MTLLTASFAIAVPLLERETGSKRAIAQGHDASVTLIPINLVAELSQKNRCIGLLEFFASRHFIHPRGMKPDVGHRLIDTFVSASGTGAL